MTLSRIAFHVPCVPGRLPALLAQEGGECPELDLSDAGMAYAEMARNVGARVEVAFDASEDPECPLLCVRTALQDAGVPFWSVRDAYVDGDGARRDGEVRVCLSGEQGDWSRFAVPWSYGEPGFDAATLAIAGVPGAVASRAISLLGPGAPPRRLAAMPGAAVVQVEDGVIRVHLDAEGKEPLSFDDEDEAAAAVAALDGTVLYGSSCDFPAEHGRAGFDPDAFRAAVESCRSAPAP